MTRPCRPFSPGRRISWRPLRTLVFGTLALSLVWTAGCAGEPNAEFVPVLLYHKVSPDPEAPGDHTRIQRSSFIEQMQYLAEEGYTTATVSELVEYMRGERTLPQKTVVLTFDDAWNSQLHAVPVLAKHGFKATFNIATRPIDGGYPAFLTWAELEGLAENDSIEFGAHSVSHPWRVGDNLVTWLAGETPGKGPADVVVEIEVPHQVLERRLERPVSVFAWPSGWYDDRLISMARKAGYEGLLTTDEKTNSPGDDPMRIGRFPVYGQFGLEEFDKLLKGAIRVTVAELLPEGADSGAQLTDAMPD